MGKSRCQVSILIEKCINGASFARKSVEPLKYHTISSIFAVFAYNASLNREEVIYLLDQTSYNFG